jgi:hypothetical protein
MRVPGILLCCLLVLPIRAAAASSVPVPGYEFGKRTAFELAKADSPEAERSLEQLLKENARDANRDKLRAYLIRFYLHVR